MRGLLLTTAPELECVLNSRSRARTPGLQCLLNGSVVLFALCVKPTIIKHTVPLNVMLSHRI